MDMDTTGDTAAVAGAVVDDSPSAGYSGCPECNTTKLMMPNLQLKFSTCCGRCMCIHCIDNRFKTTKIWNCTLCQEPLKKTSWDVLQIEEQRFKTEVINRQETNRIFTLDEIDFPSKLEYDDYLETNADIIYSLTYGTRSEQSSARQRLSEFQKTHRLAIDKSKSRKFQERAEQERKERMKEGGNLQTITAPAFGLSSHAPSFVLPQPDANGIPGGLSSIDEEKRIRSLDDPTRRQRLLWELEEKRRQAGGFKREDDRKRSRQEACQGLFI